MMQKDIQPKYNEVEVRCACGNTFMAGSTKDEIRVEICSECHPFYTGKQKNIEKGGRIDKFKKRFKMDCICGRSRHSECRFVWVYSKSLERKESRTCQEK